MRIVTEEHQSIPEEEYEELLSEVGKECIPLRGMF